MAPNRAIEGFGEVCAEKGQEVGADARDAAVGLRLRVMAVHSGCDGVLPDDVRGGLSGVPPAMCAATAQLHEGVRARSATNALERHDTHTHTHTHTLRTARRFEPSRLAASSLRAVRRVCP